jgi:hypothetical protein
MGTFMRRFTLLLVLFWLAGCPQAVVAPLPNDGGVAVDAGAPPADGSAGDAGVSLPDAAPVDSGPDCPEGTEAGDDGQCVDIDECLVDNGGCGEAPAWTCRNRYAGAPQCVFDCAPDQSQLMAGVEAFVMGNRVWPSALITHGPMACPLMRNGQNHVVVASARLERGKILQSGHEHPMNRDLLADGHDGARLVRNAVTWMTGGIERPLRIGRQSGQFGAPARLLEGDGHSVSQLRPTPEELAELDIFFFNSRTDYSDDEITALNTFVRQGGGIFSSGQAWSWAQGGAQAAVTGYPGNRVIMGSGLTVTKANQGAGELPVSEQPLGSEWHALYALFAAERHLAEIEIVPDDVQPIIGETVGFATSHLPFSLSSYYDAAGLIVERTPAVVPTSINRIRPEEQPMELLMMRLMDIFHRNVAAAEVARFVAAWDFPEVPPADTPTVSVEVEVNGTYAGRSNKYNYSGARKALRVSTGAFALPGQIVTVRVPEEAAGQGLSIQIGAHSDGLWNKEAIERFPQLIRTDRLSQPLTESASVFGGPVYILVPPGSEAPTFTAQISGAVMAPYFKFPETTLEEWGRQLQETAAPWAEIEGPHVIFTVLTDEARSIPDIIALVAFWEGTLAAMSDLEGAPHERVRKERFVLDRQISAGALHSGYPIMGHLNHHDGLLDLQSIRSSGSWGPFHELGHNHQWRDWFLPGTTEATCNLWSVYIHEQVLGLPTRTEGRLSVADRRQRRERYLNDGANFADDWNVWVALDTYLQLQEGFGWELFSSVFADYRRDSNAAAGSAQDRIDEWVQRTSDTTERNLIPFYRAWGFPISDSVVRSVERHPVWQEDPMR